MSAKNSSEIWDLVEAKREAFFALSDRVWEMPELAYTEEYRSCAEHTAMLEQQGFRVTRGVAGIPTAVMGEAGEGGPVIAILGEYDALPGLARRPESPSRSRCPGGNGHGCGHNLLGTRSLLAATAVKDYLAANGLKGRVRYYGCPAEEGGSAKGFMVRAGVFDDVDIAISWHPAAFAGVNDPISLACIRDQLPLQRPRLACRGLAASWTQRARRGRADECRRQLHARAHADRRAHPLRITDAGGSAPNVVQANATVRYLIRARDLPELQRLIERVKKIADGAALMTETRCEARSSAAMPTSSATRRWSSDAQNLQRLGPPVFDAQDRAFAAEIQTTLTDEDIKSSFARSG